MQNKRKIKLTPVSVLHYVRLAYRSALFAALLVMYIIYKVRYGEDIAVILNREPAIVVIICAVFTLEMLLRFFPSRLESPGSQKQFAQNYIKSGETIGIIGGTVVEAAVIVLPDVWLEALGGMGMIDKHQRLVCVIYRKIRQITAFLHELFIGDVRFVVDLSTALKVKECVPIVTSIGRAYDLAVGIPLSRIWLFTWIIGCHGHQGVY